MASGRNDIKSVKIARDGEYVYFRIETVDNITAYTSRDKSWMNVYIQTPNGGSSPIGYQYVLNRVVAPNKNMFGISTINADGTTGGNKTGYYLVNGNVMQLRAKLSDLGLTASDTIKFKVTDGCKVNTLNDYTTFYTTGDAAPIGRLSYTFNY